MARLLPGTRSLTRGNALCRHLLARIATQPGLRSLGLTDDALALLMQHGWPGNVRQLQNALFRAAVLALWARGL